MKFQGVLIALILLISGCQTGGNISVVAENHGDGQQVIQSCSGRGVECTINATDNRTYEILEETAEAASDGNPAMALIACLLPLLLIGGGLFALSRKGSATPATRTASRGRGKSSHGGGKQKPPGANPTPPGGWLR